MHVLCICAYSVFMYMCMLLPDDVINNNNNNNIISKSN